MRAVVVVMHAVVVVMGGGGGRIKRAEGGLFATPQLIYNSSLLHLFKVQYQNSWYKG